MKDENFMRTINWIIAAISFFFLAACTTLTPHPIKTDKEKADSTFSHEAFQNVLSKYVDNQGRVRYAELKADANDLYTYCSQLARFSPDSHPERFPSRDHRLAYWINAYNASAMWIVLHHYPISSVMDVKPPFGFFFMPEGSGFFWFHRVVLGGKTISLYSLENSLIRKRFKDPRIHFALNCASIGCPRLPKTVFAPEILDHQLKTETARFLAESRNLKIDHSGRTIYLSTIFKWFEADFTGILPEDAASAATPPLLEAVARLIPSERAQELRSVSATYRIDYSPYDWGLNDGSSLKTPSNASDGEHQTIQNQEGAPNRAPSFVRKEEK